MGIESNRGFDMLTLLFIRDLRKIPNTEQQSFVPYIMILSPWEDSWGLFGYFVKIGLIA